jgi:hypothetical protein
MSESVDSEEAATTNVHMEPEPARAASERIERLLDEVRGLAGPVAWPRVEELVHALVELYGRGLERLLALLLPASPEGARDPELSARLAGDELVASLLTLHGLHPLPLEARLTRALAEAAAELGPVEILTLEGARARVRLVPGQRRPPPEVLGPLLERLVLDVAPELESVTIEGLPPPAPDPQLVQIDLNRSRAGGRQ